MSGVAALAQQVKELAQQQAESTRVIQLLQQQRAAETNSSSSSSPSAPAASPKVPLPKMAAPPLYSGRLADTTGLDDWMREMNQQVVYYQAFGGLIKPEEQTMFLYSHLRGPALLAVQEAHKVKAFAAYTDVYEALIQRFRPVQSEDMARQKLKELSQGKRSVNELASIMQQLVLYVPKMDAGDQVHTFVYALNPSLRRAVGVKRPQTLAEAISLAVLEERYDDKYYTRSHAASTLDSAMDVSNLEVDDGEEGNRTAAAASASPSSVQAQLTAVQAQLSAMQSSSGWRPGGNSGGPRRDRDYPRTSGPYQKKRQMLDNVTPAQARERMNKGACIKCGQMGHYKDACKSTN
jgi:hypothetical protein